MFKISTTKLLSLLIFTFCVVLVSQKTTPVLAKTAAPVAQIMRWTVRDTVREALVYTPKTAKTNSTPIIFVFHGHGGTMHYMFNRSGFEKIWPEAIVVYPQGLNTPGQLTDPDGKLPGWQKAPGDMNDRDLYFFDEILKTLKHDYRIDNQRIYATGHSNGGGFTYILWATRPTIFAAFAPSAAVAGKVVKLLKPKPAMHIMGQKDLLVKTEWQKAMCNQLLKINNCSITGKNYATNATLYPSATGTPVLLYVHPGSHNYPIEANEVIIKFFKSMIKPE